MISRISHPSQESAALDPINVTHSDRGTAEPVLSNLSFTRADVGYKSSHSGGLQCN